MKKQALTVLFLCFLGTITAQEVQINEEPGISKLLENWADQNRVKPAIRGWRVQIMASTDRLQVESARNKFRVDYPEVSAEWTLEKPYYKLRVGAFRTKPEALAFIPGLNGWPGAYPIKDDEIHPRDFLEQ
ncbi:MAG: SPOR domain-containing protein [Saprospiraceae bacterium]|nr:SPOR domain-containing protein [Saprospiraceae bacterium]MCB9344502.1 SPOR domain-containing protein [Lewinellaceae bacterium]